MVVLLRKGASLFGSQVNQLYFLLPIVTRLTPRKKIMGERFTMMFSRVYAMLRSVISVLCKMEAGFITLSFSSQA